MAAPFFLTHGSLSVAQIVGQVEWEKKRPLQLRAGIKDLTSLWRTETCLLFRSPRPELCLVSRGWEGLRWDEDWVWLLWQEIEAMPVVRTDFGARGDNQEWQPPCANGCAMSLFQWSHPDDIIAPGQHVSQWVVQEIHQIICCCSRIQSESLLMAMKYTLHL